MAKEVNQFLVVFTLPNHLKVKDWYAQFKNAKDADSYIAALKLDPEVGPEIRCYKLDKTITKGA